MFPATQGIGLFVLQSAINHRCAPHANAVVTTSDAATRAEIVVVAGERAIEPGEEITFDYLLGMGEEEDGVQRDGGGGGGGGGKYGDDGDGSYACGDGRREAKHLALWQQYHFACRCGGGGAAAAAVEARE